jgi:hypothetical protein
MRHTSLHLSISLPPWFVLVITYWTNSTNFDARYYAVSSENPANFPVFLDRSISLITLFLMSIPVAARSTA